MLPTVTYNLLSVNRRLTTAGWGRQDLDNREKSCVRPSIGRQILIVPDGGLRVELVGDGIPIPPETDLRIPSARASEANEWLKAERFDVNQ